MGRRERNSVERRARLLAEARKLFDTLGVEATTVEQIAGAAELSLRTVYNFFPTKIDLLAALVNEEIQTRVMSRHRRARGIASDPRAGVLALVRSQVRTMVSIAKTEQRLIAARAILAGEHSEAGRYSGEIDAFFRTTIRNLLADYIAAGALRPDFNPDTTASLIYAMLNGLYLDWLQGEGEFEATLPKVGEYLDLILRP
ncbi:MAG: TetR/AcrR family transcriptional regulator [Burkholderiaceae bacterium]